MTLERLIRVAQTALEGSEADLGHVTAQTRLQEDRHRGRIFHPLPDGTPAGAAHRR